MSAVRTSSLRALRQLAGSNRQARGLHMTGPATFPSPLLTSERPAVNLPSDLAGLRAECRKRQLPSNGTKFELIERLSANELLQTRDFSSAVERATRPVASAVSSSSSSQPVREFNTSRALKAVNDTSTMDFAYLPDFDPDADHSPVMRVPLLPDNFHIQDTTSFMVEAAEDTVMRPTIVTASADSTFVSSPSAMSDVHDNASVDIHGMAQKVAAATKSLKDSSVGEVSGTVAEAWSGFLDDLLGPKQTSKI